MILIGIPYHQQKRYSLDHVLDWLENQTEPDVQPIMRWHMGPYGEQHAIKHQFEFFRRLALANNASLFIMEADTIPPLDGLTKLKNDDVDVVGALYRYRSPDTPIVAWPKANIEENELCEVGGMGTGAVLLSPKALKAFSFYDWATTDADYPMYDALRGKGFKIHLDTRVICKHYSTKKEYA